MSPKIKFWILSINILLIAGPVGCLFIQTTPGPSGIQDTLSPDELQELPVELVRIQGQEVRQWAVDAEASSSFSDPEWGPGQATGSPNIDRCGDYQYAWATAASDSIEWIALKYPVPVHVIEINIIQTFNPNQVVKVELIGAYGRTIEVYKGDPEQVDQPCPFTFTIPVEKTEGRFNELRVTVNQSELGLGWNQIDAVELVGESD